MAGHSSIETTILHILVFDEKLEAAKLQCLEPLW